MRFDEALQDITGKAEIRRLPDMNGVCGDVVDLTSLYRSQVARVERSVRMYPDRHVSITDEWETTDRSVSVAWQWLTKASIVRTEAGLRLEQAGQALDLRIACSSGFTIAIEDVSEPRNSQDSPNPGLYKVVIELESRGNNKDTLELIATPVKLSE